MLRSPLIFPLIIALFIDFLRMGTGRLLALGTGAGFAGAVGGGIEAGAAPVLAGLAVLPQLDC